MFLIQYITISLNLYECFKSVHDLFSFFLKIQRLIVKFLRINISDTLVDLLRKKNPFFLIFVPGFNISFFTVITIHFVHWRSALFWRNTERVNRAALKRQLFI